MTRVPCAVLRGKWEKTQNQAFVLKLNGGGAAADAGDLFLRGAAAFGRREAGAPAVAEGKTESVCESKEAPEGARAPTMESVLGTPHYDIVDGSLELPEAMAIAHVVGARNKETEAITLFVRDIAIGAWPRARVCPIARARATGLTNARGRATDTGSPEQLEWLTCSRFIVTSTAETTVTGEWASFVTELPAAVTAPLVSPAWGWGGCHVTRPAPARAASVVLGTHQVRRH